MEEEKKPLDFYEDFILPNGQRVLYSDASHTYIVNGAEVPSITSLLPLVYGDTYANVNPAILKKASEYGTAVHGELQECIDKRLEQPDYKQKKYAHLETKNYFDLIEPLYKVKPIMTEKVVVLYGPTGIPFAAGRFDLLCTVDGEMVLADFKTTSTIHRQLVTAQLNLYRKAAIQSGYFSEEDNVKLGVIHLHGKTTKYAPMIVLPDDFYLNFLI